MMLTYFQQESIPVGRAPTRMSSDRVAMRPNVNRMTQARENTTFPCSG